MAIAGCSGSAGTEVLGDGGGATVPTRSSGEVTEPGSLGTPAPDPGPTAGIEGDPGPDSEPDPGTGTSLAPGSGQDPDPGGDLDGLDEPDDVGFEPEFRPDGIELVFADGALGPAALGDTMDEIAAALGPTFRITPEQAIRVDFPSGYSVARDGEVLFWAIEEDGVITTFMTNSPRVGLDSGLRPKLALTEAVALHGEPVMQRGPESREFASFADGTGAGESLSVLVAIGEFGGPVGVYESGDLDEETAAYVSEGANIKELWFRAA